ncbi:hypothetical protein BDV27DRAFT_100424 [Aspergillus caelatus]|uniref:Uncharacterized protein n=1 Tax=Aspergillus caelatus TaxID=61420 RepID=A0A5N7A798_9EURO|nr:uncharacterized protein BDV27DRAFT_100424 [Aspergillus caelatus]KAE8365714.1 hypothetical protein BDV27DRAFT_100424 [Aspergillus caelatus]
MGVLKVLLKAILIPIVLLLVISVVVVLLIKRHRSRKQKERQLENGFQPPPIVQWVPNQDSIQKPPIAHTSHLQPAG